MPPARTIARTRALTCSLAFVPYEQMEGSREDRPLENQHGHCYSFEAETSEGVFWPPHDALDLFPVTVDSLPVSEPTHDMRPQFGSPRDVGRKHATYDRFALFVLALPVRSCSQVVKLDDPDDDREPTSDDKKRDQDSKKEKPDLDPSPEESRLPPSSPDELPSGPGGSDTDIDRKGEKLNLGANHAQFGLKAKF